MPSCIDIADVGPVVRSRRLGAQFVRVGDYVSGVVSLAGVDLDPDGGSAERRVGMRWVLAGESIDTRCESSRCHRAGVR